MRPLRADSDSQDSLRDRTFEGGLNPECVLTWAVARPSLAMGSVWRAAATDRGTHATCTMICWYTTMMLPAPPPSHPTLSTGRAGTRHLPGRMRALTLPTRPSQVTGPRLVLILN